MRQQQEPDEAILSEYDAGPATDPGPVAAAVADVAQSVENVVTEAGDRFEVFGRVGWLAKGVVYSLLGALFIRIAVTTTPEHAENEANQAGVLETIVETTGGGLLLTVLVGGLLLYILWRLFTVVLPGDWTGRALLDRGGYLVSAIVYITLCITAVDLLVAGERSDPDRREDRLVEDLVKDVMSVSLGRAAVVIAGLVVIIIGIVFAKKGIDRSFRSELERLGEVEGTTIDHLGRVGWLARGLSMGLIGVFLIRAAVVHDPEDAAGFDDSIRQLTGSAWGDALAVVVGVGFIAYGVFAALSARHRILKGPSNGD